MNSQKESTNSVQQDRHVHLPQDFPREAQPYLGPASISLAGAIANSYQWKRAERGACLGVKPLPGEGKDFLKDRGESRRRGNSYTKGGGWHTPQAAASALLDAQTLCLWDTAASTSQGRALRPLESRLLDTPPKWGCQIHACATFYFSIHFPPAKKTSKCMSSQRVHFATRKASLTVLTIGHISCCLSFHFLWRKLFILCGKYWSGLNYCY